jgi:hypothetical protein
MRKARRRIGKPGRRPPLGSQWRSVAYNARTEVNIRSADYPAERFETGAVAAGRMDERTIFDELVILNPAGGPSLIPIEKMNAREYFLSIGEDKLMISVDRAGRIRRGEWYR